MRRTVLSAALTAALSLTGLGLAGPGLTLAGAAPAAPKGGEPAARPAHTVVDQAEAALLGQGEADPTLALTELFASLDDLPATQRKQATSLLARPSNNSGSDPVKYPAGADVRRRCATNICVQYVTEGEHAPPLADNNGNGTPDWVEATRNEAQAVWNLEVGDMDYRAPAKDGTKGGNSKLDFYLANIGVLGYYGYCAPETYVGNQKWRASGYCVLDDDYAEFPIGPTPALRVTAAHEFFHAVQFNYDFGEDGWLMEATATWMEERFADSVNDSRGYLPYGQLAKPTRPLDAFGGLAHYGQWVFFERISQRWGNGAIRNIWSRLDATNGKKDDYSIQGVRKFLAAKKVPLNRFYVDFAAGNVAPAEVYSEGSEYDPAPNAASYEVGSSARSSSTKLNHLTNKNFRFVPADSLSGSWKLRLSVNGPDLVTAPGAYATVVFTDGEVVRKQIVLNRSGGGSAQVSFSPDSVARVTLTLANAGTRYDCWEGTNLSCAGKSKDNGRTFKWRAVAVR